MVQIHDTILYGSQLCRIEEEVSRDFGGSTARYYVLRPVYNDTSTIYVPMHNEKCLSRMRRVLSAEEIRALIRSMPEEEKDWVENEAARRDRYREVLASGDRRALIRMIKALHEHQVARQAQGKRLHVSDERFLKEAERALYDEFALVLNIQPEQVLPFILNEIQVSERESK